MSSADYDCVQKSSLKLKGVDEKVIKKKKKKSKKKSKDRDREREEAATAIAASTSREEDDDDLGGLDSKDSPLSKVDRRLRGKTKSEIAFLKRQFELEEAKLKDRVALTHKEKVEKFNTYLESLSEHYEQAKVSWTK